MQPFPHRYRVAVENRATDATVVVRSPGLPDLKTAAPAEYGGPGDRWSPETMLVAAVADCFVLGFRAIARASKLDWSTVTCNVDGMLDKADGRVRFIRLTIRATVTVPAGSETRAERILNKAEETCLVTNSLSASVDFQGEAVTSD